MKFFPQVVVSLVLCTGLLSSVVKGQPPLPVASVVVSVCYTNTIVRSNIGQGTFTTNVYSWCQGQYTNTNPPPPLTTISLSWLETNYTAGHGWTSNVISYSTNGLQGPWQPFAFVPVTNTNMQANLTINRNLLSAFFRVGTLSP